MKIVLGSTDTGCIRTTNQDNFTCGNITDNMVYGVLCDGMGGENGGEIASDLAVKVAAEMLSRDLREDMAEISLRSVLSSAIAAANAIVYEKSREYASLSGMGTTIVLAVLIKNTLYVAYVGDSRVYVLSSEGERQLTRDHTIVQMLVDIGEISEDDAKIHPKRHYITRAVGVSTEVEPEFLVESINENECILLCSDGLYQYMQPGKTYPVVEYCMEKGSANSLIKMANESGGSDNITAIIMK